MTLQNFRVSHFFLWILAANLVALAPLPSIGQQFDYRHPRPSGSQEKGIHGETKAEFGGLRETAGVLFDTTIQLSGKDLPEFQVEKVVVNGVTHTEFLVANGGVLNLNRRVYGNRDAEIHLFLNWSPVLGHDFKIIGTKADGTEVVQEVSAFSPMEKALVSGLGFGTPSVEHPYHHVTLTLSSARIRPGTVTGVLVDGQKARDARFFNSGIRNPRRGDKGEDLEGESFKARMAGTRDFQIIAPCAWTNGSEHQVHAILTFDDGEVLEIDQSGTAPGSGGYWNAEWPEYVSITLRETEGLFREKEPVHLSLGLFSNEIENPEKEIRVVAYAPHSPEAGEDGYVVAPVQITAVDRWADEKALNSEETDPKTGQKVHRYDPTTTVELVFFATLLPYEEKIYQVVYGNPTAPAQEIETDLRVTDTTGLGERVRTAGYEILLATNSGAVETVTLLGEGDSVILEHKLETNGAVHWNPGCYSPPIPWVHASDWEGPEAAEISGPLMHRTRRYANLPHMETVDANVSYTFYAGLPYILQSSVMRVKEDIHVKALRNGEIVFNHAVLDEFVWHDPSGVIKHLPIEGSREHPIHALEIPPDTPWFAFISPEQKVGFAAIQLEYLNTNLYGDMPSQAQPYFYVQNGPWIYWSRGLVYPFGGFNFSRMMKARAGSLYIEKIAWVPFRFASDAEPFSEIEEWQRKLKQPPLLHEWMATDPRTPETWVMPILTMPFDEGVEGAVSGHRE